MSATATRFDLDSPYTITDENVAFYQKNGFIKLKNVLEPEALAHYGAAISREVKERSLNAVPLEQRSTYGKAFLQIMNLWTHSEVVKEFVFSPRLGRIAANLMSTTGVRLYHDQALYKEPGGGITPWHADQYYWPVSSDKTITAWIPLTEVTAEMGPLQFSPGSQKMKFGRDLEIGDESEVKLSEMLAHNPLVNEPFDLGEVSFHSGWCFHRAGANSSAKPREVMTIIYVDENITLSEPRNQNQRNDWEAWCKGAKVGGILDTPTNPILWTSRA